MIYCYVLGGIFTVSALYFFPFGGINRLKGIRDLEESERKSLNLKALGINLATMLYCMAAIMFAAGASEYFLDKLMTWFAVGWVVLAVADALFIAKSRFFVKQETGGKKK